MLFAVTSNQKTRSGDPVWFPFEHPAKSLDELHGLLLRDGSVIGHRYTARYASADKPRTLENKRRFILGQTDFANIVRYGAER